MYQIRQKNLKKTQLQRTLDRSYVYDAISLYKLRAWKRTRKESILLRITTYYVFWSQRVQIACILSIKKNKFPDGRRSPSQILGRNDGVTHNALFSLKIQATTDGNTRHSQNVKLCSVIVRKVLYIRE